MLSRSSGPGPRPTTARICPGIFQILVFAVMVFGYALSACGQSVEVEKSLREDRFKRIPIIEVRPWRVLRNKVMAAESSLNQRIGLELGLANTIIYQTDPYAPTPHHATVQNFDIYGAWHLIDSATFGSGMVGFVFRDRTNIGPITGNQLSADVGLPWSVNNSGSAGYSRFNQVWWQQSMFKDTLKIQIGKIDDKTHFNTNRAASSDGREFMMQSLVYSQTIAFPAVGLGFNIHYAPVSWFYLDAGLSDANGNPQRKPNDSVNSFFQGNYFEAVEAGFSPDLRALWSGLGEGHYRLMGWHTARTEQHAGGAGVALSADQEIPNDLVTFLRVGYCPAKVYRTTTEVDTGIVSVAPFGREADRLGAGLTWAKPVQTPDRDQVAMELYYRFEVVEGIQVTPDVEFVFNPALRPGAGFQPVFGLRLRAFI
jgi:porin